MIALVSSLDSLADGYRQKLRAKREAESWHWLMSLPEGEIREFMISRHIEAKKEERDREEREAERGATLALAAAIEHSARATERAVEQRQRERLMELLG